MLGPGGAWLGIIWYGGGVGQGPAHPDMVVRAPIRRGVEKSLGYVGYGGGVWGMGARQVSTSIVEKRDKDMV